MGVMNSEKSNHSSPRPVSSLISNFQMIECKIFTGVTLWTYKLEMSTSYVCLVNMCLLSESYTEA